METKKHRIFSKALLTDYAVVEELDFEVTFSKIYHQLLDLDNDYENLGRASLIESLTGEKSIHFNRSIVTSIKALRSDRTEAIYIIAPKLIKEGRNICGQTFLLTMMKYLKKSNFLSREVVFLFPSYSMEMNDFFENLLRASSTSKYFHGIPSNILAALNIEIPGEVCNNLDSFVFKYEGDQTRPYLDFLNTLTKISDFHGLNVRFENNISKKIPVIAESMVRQFFGNLNHGHDYLLKSKIDSLTIRATEDNRSDDQDNMQEFYKFMVSTIRSLCNAIGHFQHESAIYFPTNEHNYYEFMDYLPVAIGLIVPVALLSVFDLYNFWVISLSITELYSIASEPVVLLFKLSFVSFVLTKLLQQLSVFSVSDQISNAAIFFEIVFLLLLRLFGPKIKSARMISGIILFIGSLILLFTSLGYGTIVFFIAICASTIVSIGNSSRALGLILLPLMSPKIYIRLISLFTSDNINETISNSHITLFIFPSILLLCCQKNDFKLK